MSEHIWENTMEAIFIIKENNAYETYLEFYVKQLNYISRSYVVYVKLHTNYTLFKLDIQYTYVLQCRCYTHQHDCATYGFEID